jgi:L-amino acid N-acyltransferase YncA
MPHVTLTPSFRLATAADAEQVARIYAPFCTDSAISFEVAPPTADEMRDRIVKALRGYPWLLCEYGTEVLGYVYAGPYSERAAYGWSAMTSVYIRRDQHRTGIGAGLYTSLFRILRLQGYCNAVAGITLPNAASVGLHRSFGFESVGVYPKIGYKLGAWHDVEYLQLRLNPEDGEPKPPLSLDEALRQPWWDEALLAGLPRVRVQGSA